MSDLERSIAFYKGLGLELDHIVDDRIGFLWIIKEERETDKVNLDYHHSIRHIAFHVSLEGLKSSVKWLTDRGNTPRAAFFLNRRNLSLWHSRIMHALRFILMILTVIP